MKRQNKMILILCILLLLSFIVSIHAGYTSLTHGDILRILLGGGTDQEVLILIKLRLPRIFLAIVTGSGYALSGCIMQTVVRNPLADPSIMGINAGSSLFVVIYLTYAGTLSFFQFMSLPIVAIVGALLTAVIVFHLSTSNHELKSSKIILNGIAIQLGLNGVMTLFVLYLDSMQVDFLTRFQAGSFYNATMNLVYPTAVGIILCLVYLLCKTKTLDLMLLGNDLATGLGIKVKEEKTKFIIVAVIAAAVCVSASGSLNFVGLVSPHIARKLVGNKHKYLIVTSVLIGSILVMISDAIGRVILGTTTLPVGLVTSMIGAPYFLYLLVKGKK